MKLLKDTIIVQRMILGLLAFLLLVAPVAVQAQFGYMINFNNTNTITITNYTGTGGVVTIPNAINGLKVTIIGYGAFNSCTKLTNVIIASRGPDTRGRAGIPPANGLAGLG